MRSLVSGTVILLAAASLTGSPVRGGPPADLSLQEDLVLGLGEDVLLGKIWDVAVDAGGNVYLLDSGFDTVHKFSADGEFLLDLGREGEAPGEFYNPLCLTTGPDNRVYVGGNSSFITVLEADGTPAESIKRERAGMVRSLCFDAAENLYVCAFDRAGRKMIHKYTAGDFVYERSFGEPYGEGRDVDPRIEGVYASGMLAPAPGDGVYYCQMVPQLVRVYAADGRLNKTHAVRSDMCGLPEPEITDSGINFNAAFNGASALEVFPDGSFLTVLWVAGEEEGEGHALVDVYDENGELTRTRTMTESFRVRAVDGKGRIYVCEERDDVPVVVRYRLGFDDEKPAK